MALPSSLLSTVEKHRCFSGCFSADARGVICVDAVQAPEPMLLVHCSDCLGWHVGALRKLLPRSIQSDSDLASELTEHVRKRRGFLWSVGGYHTVGSGFWLNAACLGPGLFLVGGMRGSGPGPLDRLILGFQHRLAPITDSGMLDPKLYQQQQIWVDFSGLSSPLPDRQTLLASPRCLGSYRPGYTEVSLLEYLPLAASATPPSRLALRPQPRRHPPVRAPAPTQGILLPAVEITEETTDALVLGQVCPRCGAEVKERPLLTGTFVGCLC